MKKSTFKTGAVGGMLALTLMTAAVPVPRAEAASIQDLQAQIQALIAQINTLKGNMPATSNLGSCDPFSIDMTLGRSGNEVTSLQKFLIGQGHAIPAGATGYFGGQTRTALAQFQKQHGITPAAGYFGPKTRGKVNALCAANPKPNQGNNGGNSGTPKPAVSLQGEASFENYDALSGDDTNLQEGQKNVSIMDVRFDVEDGDARINRIDLGFTPQNTNDEKKPWKTFSEVAVYAGDTRIAKIDASKKTNWKENTPSSGDYLLRLSGIDYVVSEDDTAELTVKVTTANSITGTNNGEIWNVFVPNNGIRAMDADKTAVYTGDSADSVSIDIDKAGSTDELLVKRSDSDPDATTLQLKDDARSGYLTVFAFDLDTDDSKNDIEIRKIPVKLSVNTGTVDTFMRDARLVIDGKTYTKKTITDGATNTMVFEFGSNELVIGNGDRVTAKLEVDFKPLSTSNEGTTLSGSVNAAQITAEGADDLTGSQLSGSATGETHTLRTRGIMAEAGTKSSTVTTSNGAANDYATYSVQTKVTAFGQDVYIPADVASAVSYQLESGSGTALSDTGSAVLTSNAREENGYFRILEGETKTVTLTITYKPEVSMTTARLQLLSIAYNDTAASPTQTWSALPQADYETEVVTIVD